MRLFRATGLVGLCAAMLVGAACAERRSATSPTSGGAAPYTPTRLEWFVVKLNAAQRAMPTESQPGYWFAQDGPDTVHVLLTDCGGSMKLNDIIDRAEEAEALAKSWGRDLPWLKTKVEVCGRPLEWLKRK